MSERRIATRSRTLRTGKILFNHRSSVIDCVIRNVSESGACLSVQSSVGVPAEFELLIDENQQPLRCMRMWESANRFGVAFLSGAERPKPVEDVAAPLTTLHVAPAVKADEGQKPDLLRGQLLALRAALDEVAFGVVLLDHELRAQFINRAFRRMWRLGDAKADSNPAFVALMYHGRETRAYAVPEGDLPPYIAERVAHVKAGNPAPVDIRLASGEVIRFQCAVLPAGGRMLSYTYVSDIVQHSDELEMLKSALDKVEHGVILLDADLKAQFMNQAVRKLWKVSDEQAERKPSYAELVNDAHFTGVYEVAPADLDAYIAERLAWVRTGNTRPMDIAVGGGRVIRSQCAVLASGGRMLTYHDVTDLVRQAEELQQLAITDGLTQVFNRRHILALATAEWVRFQRYYRPLSVLAIDVDRFKTVNDQFGHAAGDRALLHVVDLVKQAMRSSDIIGRTGGDEFLVLLPETGLEQAQVAAERLCALIRSQPLLLDGTGLKLTVSVGIAEASLSMSGIDVMLQMADSALYAAKANGRDGSAVRMPMEETQRLAAQ